MLWLLRARCNIIYLFFYFLVFWRQAQLEKEAADRLAAAAAAAEKKRQRNLNIKNRCNKKKYL